MAGNLWYTPNGLCGFVELPSLDLMRLEKDSHRTNPKWGRRRRWAEVRCLDNGLQVAGWFTVTSEPWSCGYWGSQETPSDWLYPATVWILSFQVTTLSHHVLGLYDFANATSLALKPTLCIGVSSHSAQQVTSLNDSPWIRGRTCTLKLPKFGIWTKVHSYQIGYWWRSKGTVHPSLVCRTNRLTGLTRPWLRRYRHVSDPYPATSPKCPSPTLVIISWKLHWLESPLRYLYTPAPLRSYKVREESCTTEKQAQRCEGLCCSNWTGNHHILPRGQHCSTGLCHWPSTSGLSSCLVNSLVGSTSVQRKWKRRQNIFTLNSSIPVDFPRESSHNGLLKASLRAITVDSSFLNFHCFSFTEEYDC